MIFFFHRVESVNAGRHLKLLGIGCTKVLLVKAAQDKSPCQSILWPKYQAYGSWGVWLTGTQVQGIKGSICHNGTQFLPPCLFCDGPEVEPTDPAQHYQQCVDMQTC